MSDIALEFKLPETTFRALQQRAAAVQLTVPQLLVEATVAYLAQPITQPTPLPADELARLCQELRGQSATTPPLTETLLEERRRDLQKEELNIQRYASAK